eukprot:703264-Rhodomonas_salina.1
MVFGTGVRGRGTLVGRLRTWIGRSGTWRSGRSTCKAPWQSAAWLPCSTATLCCDPAHAQQREIPDRPAPERAVTQTQTLTQIRTDTDTDKDTDA